MQFVRHIAAWCGVAVASLAVVPETVRPVWAQPPVLDRTGERPELFRLDDLPEVVPLPTGPSVPPPVNGFPELPPDPYADQRPPLPPLEQELWLHGGSYLYQPEGDRLNWPGESADEELLRLPEDWQEPRPLTAHVPFLGTGPIVVNPRIKWPGAGGYVWEPRFVGYGSYELFGLALAQNDRRQDLVGHQLLFELDLRLTGTERMHAQFRPLGAGNSGGSFYQFSAPEGYRDNSTGEPQRYWFEGELQSILGNWINPFAAMDYHFVVGKFPFALHNSMLMDDEVLGLAVNKNTIYLGQLSNLNVQLLYAWDDVDAIPAENSGRMYALHLTADRYRDFFEVTYALVKPRPGQEVHYAAASGTHMSGPVTVAARGFLKWGESARDGAGQLVALETNWTRYFDRRPLGVSHAVLFCNGFWASPGWSPISGANFNRVRTAFEVNPLVRLSAGLQDDVVGVSLGGQFFRRHEDESFIPEIAYESRGGTTVWGIGLRYLRKTGPRTFLEVLGVWNESVDPRFDRDGVFASHSWIF